MLVNNAGVTRDGLVMRMKDEDWNTIQRIHLDGTFYCTRAVMRSMMKQRHGRIINMTSIVGLRGQAGQSNYAAAKAGIIGFTKAVAQEVATRNITVNAVAPGFIETVLTVDLPDEIKDFSIKMTPLGRFGVPQDIANAVAFLAADESSFITGVTLHVDGGMVM